MFWNGGISNTITIVGQLTYLEREMKGPLDLVRFIIDLMGLSSAHVDQAFADFVNDYQLSAVQVEFLETIKQFLTRNGRIDPVKLYESPFKNYQNCQKRFKMEITISGFRIKTAHNR